MVYGDPDLSWEASLSKQQKVGLWKNGSKEIVQTYQLHSFIYTEFKRNVIFRKY